MGAVVVLNLETATKCSNCKARRIRVKLAAQGSFVYVDADPRPDGVVAIISTGLKGDKKSPPLGAVISAARRAEGGTFYRIHGCK